MSTPVPSLLLSVLLTAHDDKFKITGLGLEEPAATRRRPALLRWQAASPGRRFLGWLAGDYNTDPVIPALEVSDDDDVLESDCGGDDDAWYAWDVGDSGAGEAGR